MSLPADRLARMEAAYLAALEREREAEQDALARAAEVGEAARAHMRHRQRFRRDQEFIERLEASRALRRRGTTP